MREKLQTLSLVVLKDLAKSKGLKRVSTMKKSELIEAILEAHTEDELQENTEKEAAVEHNAVKSAAVKSEAVPVKPEPKQEHVRETDNQNRRPQQNDNSNNYAHKRNDVHRNENTNHERPKEPLKQDYDPSLVDKESAAEGILEVMQEGYGFIRCENFLPGENDVYVSPVQIKRFGLRTGDIIEGAKRVKSQGEKFSALLYIKTVNGQSLAEISKRKSFDKLTPIFPNERIHLELSSSSRSMRIMDLISPIGKGQRGMIVSPPKAGKTTLLKQVAKSITTNNKDMHLIILLIDERPEEVTDIKESIQSDNVEVIYSTFDELPERHKRVSEMVIERAKRLVEQKCDVCILLDSITRLTRAYNTVIAPSGRTLSGGLDPAALYMPKRFFGAARNMREGGSLTILATALVETGSKMDDVVYEEFKGTGNMEIVLDRKLSERRIFPAIDIVKSGTRREDLLLNNDEQEAVTIMRRSLNSGRCDDAVERIIDLFTKTRSNAELCYTVKKKKIL